MCLAAAHELENQPEERGLSVKRIPTMNDWEVFPREATAVAEKAIEQGCGEDKTNERRDILVVLEPYVKRAARQVPGDVADLSILSNLEGG